MRIELSPHEARVIGCLIEKQITTPAQYPLSLSALTVACNQKSSRDPVMQLSDAQVQQTVDGLLKRHLVSDRGGFGSRVTKYQHRFGNVGFGSLEFTAQELGIICVLLLRGPQTAGELRARSSRLCELADAQQTEAVINGLIERPDGPFVARLARDAGTREPRYVHLFGDRDAQTITATDTPASFEPEVSGDRKAARRLEELEDLVLMMQGQLDDVLARLERLEGGSGHP
ncbi:MAG TPA: DUF480 domain-containing protein [Gammaproteobacteria bacterium]|nr:DUF480 domain-containing protein [Gammaproteobacteria bacterium]